MNFDEYLNGLQTFLTSKYGEVDIKQSSYGIHIILTSGEVATYSKDRIRSYIQAINDNQIDTDTSYNYIFETVDNEIVKQKE